MKAIKGCWPPPLTCILAGGGKGTSHFKEGGLHIWETTDTAHSETNDPQSRLLTHFCGRDIWQHERAVVQKGYRFEAVLFSAVVGDLSVKHLVPVEF